MSDTSGHEWIWYDDDLAGWTDILPSIIQGSTTIVGGLLARKSASDQAKAALAIAEKEQQTAIIAAQIQAEGSGGFNLSKFVSQNPVVVYGLMGLLAVMAFKK